MLAQTLTHRRRFVVLPLVVGVLAVLLATVAQAKPERVTLEVRGMG